MTKPIFKSEDQAREDVLKWLNKPEHTHAKPGQEALTASDDVDDPKNHSPHKVDVTDEDGDV